MDHRQQEAITDLLRNCQTLIGQIRDGAENPNEWSVEVHAAKHNVWELLEALSDADDGPW